MNRLQKKCLIATAGGHLLLIVILLVGPGFFTSQPKVEDARILEFIPLDAKMTDKPFNNGVPNAQPPSPTPPTPVVQPPAPLPPPTPAPPVVQPPEPAPQPDPPKVEEQPTPDAVEPLPRPPKKTKIETPKISLTRVVRRTPVKPKDTSEADEQAKADEQARKDAQRRARAFTSAANTIKTHSSTATEIQMQGTGSASYANYKDTLGTIFYNAWIPPNNASNENAITKVSITIAGDGTILSWRIIDPSGDAAVDASVRRAMDRVPSVPPLPDGAKQRTISIYFNLNTKRMLG